MKLLIIKLSSIGDLVHTIPAYKLLKKSLANKAVQVDWLVYENLAPVLYEPIGKENLICLKDKKLSTLIQKATELKNHYDYVIDLQGLFKTALISKIIAPNGNNGFKKPREAWASYFYKKSFCDYKSIESKKHVIEQNLELVSEFIKSTIGNETISGIDFAINQKEKNSSKQSVCFIPATTWESKHWELNNWTELIQSFDENKYDLFMTGAPINLNYLKQIKELSTKNIRLVTDKKLEDLYSFYQEMDIVIGVDTGPLHIAAAALYKSKENKKVIGIYGPSSGSRSGPYGFTAISSDELFKLKATNKKTYLKDFNSINLIKPELILKELQV
jgi:heptosyltransferase I